MIQFQASQNYIHRKITGQDVLICVGEDIANFNGYVQLNATAAALWDAMSAPKTAAELEKLLIDGYGISGEDARSDVAEFLTLLQENKMIRVIGNVL